jgi:hypothetical protein
VSHALYECGVKLNGFTGTRCWNCSIPPENGKHIHAIRAQELATYLNEKPFVGLNQVTDVSPATFDKDLHGKTGITFFKDYWTRQGQNHPTGDHIDLWDGNELAGSGFFISHFRINNPTEAEEYLVNLP